MQLQLLRTARYSRPMLAHLRSLRAPGTAAMVDSLAVILVDFPPFEEISEPGFQAAYFMGASRARQLFAAVHVSSTGL